MERDFRAFSRRTTGGDSYHAEIMPSADSERRSPAPSPPHSATSELPDDTSVHREELKSEDSKKGKTWMTEDILEIMEERRKHKNNAQLYTEIQRTIDTKIKEAKEK
ncbi:hypothetical protein HUJ05_001715 [Dendroctonus ponderosae]|nr:hypothetical protein HUJ05_001715 [Dendroctonus ponderosae]